MLKRPALFFAVACVIACVVAPASFASGTFHPRIRNGLGLVPPVNSQGSTSSAAEPNQAGLLTPVTYHGGPTMANPSGVTVHVIFWTPYAGTKFPAGPTISNENLITQFYSDLAATSTTASPCDSAIDPCSVFSVEDQFGSGTTPLNQVAGNHKINFNSTSQPYSGTGSLSPTADVITDTDAPPALPSGQPACSSPLGAKYCIMDSQVQAEVAKLVQASISGGGSGGSEAGTKNLWYVFLPPDVDECIYYDSCGTNAFGGYHSISDVGSNGVTIYAVTIDPTIEAGQIAQGADPQGNPDGEVVVDIAAHETNEAMSDPEGTGYMNPNGWEIGDMCEFGPQRGTPLGYSTATGADNSPYNQLINGHQYLIQEMWSNDGGQGDNNPSCVQGTTNSQTPLPLPQVDMNQFSSTVSGNTENTGSAGGGTVTVDLYRDESGSPIVEGQGTIASNGTWSVSLSPYAVGDDRDALVVNYSGAGAPSTTNDPGADQAVILTGNGGDPFAESGWTGWTGLDNGNYLTNDDQTPWSTSLTVGGPSLTVGPCFQAGVLSDSLGSPSPTNYCSTAFDLADTPLAGPVSPSQAVTVSSMDNRSFQPQDTQTPNLVGSLVNMTVPVGEPDSVSSFAAAQFPSTGFPTCTADLTAQTATCTGLVPGDGYTVHDGSQSVARSADGSGTVVAPLTISRGDSISLSNGSRTLTTLRVANLKVALSDANPGLVDSGTCSPDLYWGGPLSTEPTNGSAGDTGIGASGTVCPPNADASGLSTPVAQTDDRSGGSTVVNLPDVADTSPINGESVYGAFTALSESTGEALPIKVSIAPAGGGATVFTASNTDSTNGVSVNALGKGSYRATWTVTDPNGDTRTMTTRFIELGAPKVSNPKLKVSCRLVGKTHRKIRCRVTFPKSSKTVRGALRVRIARGHTVAALGHAQLRRGAASLTMRELHQLSHGTWRVTLVVRPTHQGARTITMQMLVA